jgi:phosphoglycolate phosphatase
MALTQPGSPLMEAEVPGNIMMLTVRCRVAANPVHHPFGRPIAMPRFRAVLFDFDGTLADSYAAITASVNHVLEHHGRPTLTEAQVRTLVGHGLENLMARILPGIDPAAGARLYREHHPTVMESHTRLLPGVADGLAALRAAGIRLGVCSNKLAYFTRALLAILKIDRAFDVVYGPEDAGAAKPDPAMLLKALETLSVPTTEALYVGDMEVDIETGRRAGVETWVLPTGSHDEATLRAANPVRVFPGMNEVIAEVLPERS